MDDLFLVLFLLSFIALILGMIKPSIVIRWGDIEKRNRKNVLKLYGSTLIASFFLFGVTVPSTDVSKTEDNLTQEEQEQVKQEEQFKLSDSDKELLKGSYADFSNEQISRFEEIEYKYKELDEDLKEEVKVEVERLVSERVIVEEAKAEEEARIKAEKEEKERIEAEEKAKAEKEKYNTGITTRDIARDRNGLEGSLVKFSGKIIQVINGKLTTQYRMAVNDDYDQIIFIEIANDKLESNILEDDYITIEGVSVGNITYTTIFGAEQTIPGVEVHNFYY